jgi:hypothetical protein
MRLLFLFLPHSDQAVAPNRRDKSIVASMARLGRRRRKSQPPSPPELSNSRADPKQFYVSEASIEFTAGSSEIRPFVFPGLDQAAAHTDIGAEASVTRSPM